MSSNSLARYANSLAQSFQIQSAFRAEFERRTFSTFDEAAREISLNWDPSFLPNFELRDNHPFSRQPNSFTLFSFAESISGLLIGLEELGAYDLLETHDFDQFANFASYTSCFHLIDSFLCLAGTYYIPRPVEGCIWELNRRMTIPEARGTPMYVLNPLLLRIGDQRPQYLIGVFIENESGNSWSFTPESRGSIHVSRWRVFGDKLKALVRADGDSSLPQPLQQFFRLFQGPLAYLGLVGENEAAPLTRLIDYACSRSQFDGITTEPFAPKVRNLAVYRNQSLDDYLRRLGPTLDSTIIDAPSKIYGAHFHRLATGLAAWQVDRFAFVLSQLGRELARDVFNYGLRCALLFSGLVELDFSRIVNNPLYDTIPAALRDIVAARFRGRRYIPGRIRGPGWQVGGRGGDLHFLRLPRTIPDLLTPRPDWLPRITYFLSEEP